MKPHSDKVLSGEYDINGLDLGEGARVLDIGANVGAFARWAEARFPGAAICCYEPNPEAYGYLEENISGTTIKAHNLAIVRDAGTRVVRMRPGKNNLGECSMFDVGEQEMPGEILAFADHAAVLPPCDFLKIDTEGAEVDILAGYRHLAQVKAVALEWHRASDVERITDILQDAGFTHIDVEPTGKDRGIYKAARFDFVNNGTDTADIFFGIPVHYQPTALFAQSLIRVEKAFPGCEVCWHIGDSHPDRARNAVVAKFLQSGKKWLWFLDADLVLPEAAMLKMFRRNRKLIGGCYAKKKPGPASWVLETDDLEPDIYGLHKCRTIGTGCLLIHREVIEAIMRAYPEKEYKPCGQPEAPSEHAVFWSGVWDDPRAGYRRWMSEDWMFCTVARQLGFEIYADPGVVCLHEGACLFPIFNK